MACLMYETVLLFGVIVIAALAYGLLTGQRHAMQGREGLFIIAFLLVPGLYFVGYWSHTGQTLPMQTWGIRLVDADGQPVSRWRAMARYLACWIWVLPALGLAQLLGWHSAGALSMALLAGIVVYALLALAHPQRQFWHDALCGTRLIDVRPPKTG